MAAGGSGDDDEKPGCGERALLWYVDKAVRCPAVSSLGLFFAFVFLAVVGMIAMPLEDPFILTEEGNPQGMAVSTYEDSLVLGSEDTLFNPATNLSAVYRQQSGAKSWMEVIYWTTDGSDILTEANLKHVREYETRIRAVTGFSEVCWKPVDASPGLGACTAVNSFTKYMHSTPNTGCSAGTSTPQSFAYDGKSSTVTIGIDGTLKALIDPSAANTFCFARGSYCNASCLVPDASSVSKLVRKDFNYTSNRQSDITKSIFTFGAPLKGYTSKIDGAEAQTKIYKDIKTKLIKPILDGSIGTIRAGTTDEDIFFAYAIEEVLPSEMVKIFFAIIVVWLICLFKLDSFLLATMGVTHIIVSWLIGYFFWTQLLLQMGPQMPFMIVLVPFLILGIGADDLFIFIDAWRQCESEIDYPGEDASKEAMQEYLKDRLHMAYKRSAWAMLITSLTTGIAFIQLYFQSEMIGIKAFGFCTAMTVLTDYVMVVSYYPCLVMWWERDIVGLFTVYYCEACKKTKGERQKHPIERFFHDTFAPLVHKARFGIIAGVVVWSVVCAVFASTLEASAEGLTFFPSDDPYQRAFDLSSDGFARNTKSATTTFVHGLAALDRGDANEMDANTIGTVRYDEAFDPNQPNFQATYLAFCERVRGYDYVVNREVLCPMDLFKAYVEDQGETFPVPDSEFVGKVQDYVRAYEEAVGPAPDLSTEFTPLKRKVRRIFGSTVYDLFRFDRTRALGAEPKLKYMVTVANITGKFQFDVVAKVEPQYDYFNAKMAEENARPGMQSATLGKGFQTSNRYIDMGIGKDVRATAQTGIYSGLILAVCIIAIATGDIRLALLTIFSIACSVASLIATIVWMGWPLGILEAVCIAVLVGLSVDYSLHFAVAWRGSSLESRLERAQVMLEEVGISVIMASITTMVSALCLVACYIIFFQKFGIFVLLTIMYSTLYSFFFLTAMLVAFGPTSPQNDFVALFDWCRGKCASPSKQAVEPQAGSTVWGV